MHLGQCNVGCHILPEVVVSPAGVIKLGQGWGRNPPVRRVYVKDAVYVHDLASSKLLTAVPFRFTA
jgi:hypothetical protein